MAKEMRSYEQYVQSQRAAAEHSAALSAREGGPARLALACWESNRSHVVIGVFSNRTLPMAVA